ncbi:hypothetical protein PPL_00306 [Heterostelium album PN500]|uniref:SAM domain-containing protein n=1 Tax=Heterostelium pallidum (strain ATCC 26659 / Pp 5 / PN500) TaxID=670386 RepID=D3AW38_HETP5|nr:hypothetical protein PPL_00306 [Heterostelium album PN500]EFA86511.1 hypothetical protein PPL_00306 [Heterostelium album PN500]|eukprot:XP_020438616.1 hypothetical protein PPL_00306 [Heterostelium album PN500]
MSVLLTHVFGLVFAKVSASATPKPPLIRNCTKWSVDEVAKWASGISPAIFTSDDVQTLKQQRVNGPTLLTLTEQKLLDRPYRLTGGAATELLLAINNLKIFAKTQDATKLQDPNLPDRHDPKWDYLRNLEQLKRKVGQFIELPNIGGTDEKLPMKLLGDKIKSYLLTRERYDLVEKFYNMVNVGKVNVKNANQQSGIILSGSNGVGKTFESYLLTCVAYMNNAILFYIVCICS